MKFSCPCCDHLTLPSKPPGTFEICPVCDWEDDAVQFWDPTFSGGANELSLREARANFKKFGASTREALSHVRKPKPDELPLPSED